MEISFAKDNVVNRPRSQVKWTISTGGSITPMIIAGQSAVAAAIQVSGTFGGATVIMQCSNDGATWFPMLDASGVVVSATDDAFFEISSAALYIRPSITGGTSDSVNVILVLRG